MAEQVHQFIVETHLSAYQQFFDLTWANELSALTKDTALDRASMQLAFCWKGASLVHSIPSLLARWSESLLEGAFTGNESPQSMWVQMMRERLVVKLTSMNEPIRPMLVKKLNRAIEELAYDVNSALAVAHAATRTSAESIWDDIANDQTLAMMLQAQQRMIYITLCRGYECFVLDCLRIAKRQPTFRIKGRDATRNAFVSLFGETVFQSCWLDSDLDIARRVRHSILHDNGRETDELRRVKHEFVVTGGELQIVALSSAKLFNVLKGKAIELAQATLKALSNTSAKDAT